MSNLETITALTINWRTRDLTQLCVETFRRFYPQIPMILIDNGSRDASTDYILDLARGQREISAILNLSNIVDRPGSKWPRVGLRDSPYGQVFDLDPPETATCLATTTVAKTLTGGNIGHGPALHQALKMIKTSYLLALDSDCEVLRGGFIELMMEYFKDPKVYAVGRKVFLSRSGSPRVKGAPHIHESVILLDVEKYRTLEPYVHYGVPSLLNMPDAIAKGFSLVDFPIGWDTSWVHHKFLGSRKRYHAIPHARSRPIMPEVFLRNLKTEIIGEYFD